MILSLRMLYFEDLSVGMTETLSKTIASSDVIGFAQLDFRAPVEIGDQLDVTVTVAEFIAERQRARLTCTCRVADKIVLDGEALVKVPSAAKSKRPLPRV